MSIDLKVDYVADEGPSSAFPTNTIWADCPVFEMMVDKTEGFHFHDDFMNATKSVAGATGAASGGAGLGYNVYGDAGVTIGAESSATEGNGMALAISANDADNDEGIISTGSPAFLVSDTAAFANRKLWFEARIKKASVADNGVSQFIGLAWDDGAGTSIAAAEALVDDTGALGAFSYLGFHQDAANGDSWDFVYKAEGQAQTVAISGVDVIVADTYAKLGFVFDPSASAGKRITVYVDGVAQATGVSDTNIAAVTFPDGEGMGMAWATKVGAAAAVVCTLDWWRAAQKF